MSLQAAIVSVFQRCPGFSDREWRSAQRQFTLFGLGFFFSLPNIVERINGIFMGDLLK